MFLAGSVTVLAGGLVGGFAQDLATLIVSRVLIGVGTSAGLDAPPGSVLGGLVIAAMVTPAVGLPIGGVLVQAWGRRAVFFANVPVTLGTLAMAALWIPQTGPLGRIRGAPPGRWRRVSNWLASPGSAERRWPC